MKKVSQITGLVFFLIITMLGYNLYEALYDIQSIEGQEIIQEVSSPNGTYTVTAYLNNGGATSDYAVLCSVKTNVQSKEKNIYWQYHCKDVSIVWVNDYTVQINDVELNVKTDTYDYRYD